MSDSRPATHGVATRAQLEFAGVGDAQICTLVGEGTLTRLRPGWFATADADPRVVSAVRAGGAVTCVSALRLHGAWVPPEAAVHVRRSGHHRRKRLPPGVQDCSLPRRRAPQVDFPVDRVDLALQSALGCVDPDMAVVLMDSVLNKQLLTIDELEPLRLGRRGIRTRVQVQIGDVGRVDLLIGERLVIEVDSRRYHTSDAAYQSDRERDRRLNGLLYRVIRLTYQDVMHHWEPAEADILAIVRAGEHRWVRRPNSFC